jgi:hypothetical protein
VLGLDYNLASADGKWSGKVFYHQSFTPASGANPFATAAAINYNSTRFNVENLVSFVGEDYRAETGFVPRRGLLRNAASVMYVIFPKGGLAKLVNNIRIGPDWDVYYGTLNQRVTDWDAGLFGRVQFQNSALLSFALFRNDYTTCFLPLILLTPVACRCRWVLPIVTGAPVSPLLPTSAPRCSTPCRQEPGSTLTAISTTHMLL